MSRNLNKVRSQAFNEPEQFYRIINTQAEVDAQHASEDNKETYKQHYDTCQSVFQEAVFKDIGIICQFPFPETTGEEQSE